MYKKKKKTDGLKVYIKPEDVLAYEEMEDHVQIITVIGDFEVINTIEEIFGNTQNIKFSNN